METQYYMEEYVYYLYGIFLRDYDFHSSGHKYTHIKSIMGRLPNTTYIPSDPNTPIIVGPKE